MISITLRGQKRLQARLKALAETGGGKWGWLPELRRIAKHLRDVTQARLRGHLAPGGSPWPSYWYEPMPMAGKVPMIVGGGAGFTGQVSGARAIGRGFGAFTITQDIATPAGIEAARRYRQRFGPPDRPVPALVRTRAYPGARKRRKILDFLTGAGYMGRAARITKDSVTGARALVYGYTAGSEWIRELHFGGTSKKYRARIPPRPVLGATAADEAFMAATFKAGWQKRVAKLSGGRG